MRKPISCMVLDKWFRYAVRFNFFTVLVFVIGGIEYFSLAYRLFIALYVCICLGLMKLGFSYRPSITNSISWKQGLGIRSLMILRFLGLAYVMYIKTRGDFSSIFFWNSSSSIGELYFEHGQDNNGYNEHWIALLFRRLVQILNLFIFALIARRWKEVLGVYRLLFLFSVFIEIIYWLSIGTNIGIFQILFFWLIFRERSLSITVRQGIYILCICILANSIFESRLEHVYGQSMVLTSVHGNPVEDWLKNAGLVPTTVYRYLTESYYFLGEALLLKDLPYSLRYAGYEVLSLSSSLGLTIDIQAMIQSNVGENANAYAYWHGAYTWYANVIGFTLTPLVFWCHGWLLRTILVLRSKTNVVLFDVTYALLILQIFLFVANNHLLSFWLYELIWIFMILSLIRVWRLFR